MLEEVDLEVLQWIRSVPGVPPPVQDAGAADPAQSRIDVHLFDLSTAPPKRHASSSVRELRLRYLVTASAADASTAHAALGKLLAAAFQLDDWTVEGAPSPELWLALQMKPQAAFVLSVPRSYRTESSFTSRVSVPLIQKYQSLGLLKGRVIGPGEIGVMAARVEAVALNRSALTDAAGWFQFAGMPDKRDLDLRVLARGEVLDFKVPADHARSEPVVIRLEFSDLPSSSDLGAVS